MKKYLITRACWCGSSELVIYNDDYALCKNCKTLVLQKKLEVSTESDSIDGHNIYEDSYWNSYMFSQYSSMGCTSIEDIILLHYRERTVYWGHTLLKYLLPPAQVVEIGCGMGTLVHLLNKLGFNAQGYELSKTWCNFIKTKLDIPIFAENFENSSIAEKSLDAVIMMDVIEHFENPQKIMRSITNKLKNEGILVIQTPCYNFSLSYQEALQREDNFLRQLLPNQHIYLFSLDSLKQFLRGFGFTEIYQEKNIFPSDMFLIASRMKKYIHAKDKINKIMTSIPDRIIPFSSIIAYNTLEKIQNSYFELQSKYSETCYELKSAQVELTDKRKELSLRGHQLVTKFYKIRKNLKTFLLKIINRF